VVVALAVGAICGGVLAGMSAPLAGRGHLDQALLTLGCALVLADLVVVFFGRDVHGVAAPPGLDGSVSIAGQAYPVYRLALIGVGLALALAIYVVVERTRLGSLVRAAVADRAMLEAMGVDSRKVLLGVFAAGCALAAFAGALGAQIYGARPGLEETILLLALVVVVIGGLGSIKGALVGALIIGQVESLGRALVPELAPFLLFGAMGLVLLFRPRGLFGSPAAAT
jgi:branched-subunit amino acid ABC-type transport system permease component